MAKAESVGLLPAAGSDDWQEKGVRSLSLRERDLTPSPHRLPICARSRPT